MITTRFAPSPTGELHLGHAYAALFAHEQARAQGGRFFLRLEDIDHTRCRAEYEEQIFNDLHWLGLEWDEPVWRQSERAGAYREALQLLQAQEVIYPCFCTRAEIMAEIAQAGHAPHGPTEIIYPGTCRTLSTAARAEKLTHGLIPSWRLDSARVMNQHGALSWTDERLGAQSADLTPHGDVIISRRDIGVSYHLAVVIDDAAQGITLVTRGEDLAPATAIHRHLISLLSLPLPRWQHHRLILDEKGQRLAKRDQARSLRSLRESGQSASDILAQLKPALPEMI
jgi:glutamyl-Q tRNA(Asp) synthetase